ncbi:TylF/MycF/NovP-related O-methyltransferase [Paraburkholderia sp.]|uniref:TylF/MycF/NovP-related O-methyltransferase n=1 Tax=Paraburkholderia sp. TaxID=1926495 RepID=UPI0023A3B70C|nr:TylF/MycF/NovP-related O-methyltransferase [Paraburkholderia sp.]MDE1184171.1 macrocin O-methyltransferase [Paraburkholderia sp.]
MDQFKRIPEADLFSNLAMYEPFSDSTKDLSPAAFPGRNVYIVTDQQVPAETVARLGATVLPSLDGLTDDQIARALVYVYFGCDSDAVASLRRLKAAGGTYVPQLNFMKTEYRFVNRKANDALRATWSKSDRVSHLLMPIHENICEAIEITSHLGGDYVEIGVFRGGSALTALNYLEQQQHTAGATRRKAWLLDTFEGFNYEEARTSSDALWSDTHKLYGRDATMAHIRETLSHITVPFEMVAGNICADELPAEITRISVANIDVDMYEPTLAAYRKVADLIEVGGLIIAEDPASTPGLYGALLAMEEFLESEQGKRFYKVFKGSQYFLIKMR